MEAMDELEDGGALDFPNATLRGIAVIVAVDHGDSTSINYRFKNAKGAELDTVTGLEMLRRVREAISP
jgi:hypothetical protein